MHGLQLPDVEVRIFVLNNYISLKSYFKKQGIVFLQTYRTIMNKDHGKAFKPYLVKLKQINKLTCDLGKVWVLCRFWFSASNFGSSQSPAMTTNIFSQASAMTPFVTFA